HAALAARGTFAGGIYRAADGRPRDGYEAVWEHVQRQSIAYPPPRFDEPILMWPEHWPWVPSGEEPGVATKLLGIFSERGLDLRAVRLEPGAVYAPPPGAGARLLLVLAGAVRCDTQEIGLQGAACQAAGERICVSST